MNAGLKAIKRTMNIWTNEEIAIIREVYPTGGTRACAERISRSTSAIAAKARELGILMEPGAKAKVHMTFGSKARLAWSKDEDAVIYSKYEEGGWKPVHDELPHRSCEGIKMRAMTLGVAVSQSARARMGKECLSVVHWDGRPERSVVNDALAMRR